MNISNTNPAQDEKEHYLAELTLLLADLPVEEREQALTYYREYFDDAGTDQVARVLAELGPPATLAAQILSGYGRDYQDVEPRSSSQHVPARPEEAAAAGRREQAAHAEQQRAQAERERQKQQAERQRQARSRRNTSVLLIILAVLALPILIPIAVSVLSVIIGILAAVVGLVVSALALMVACLFGGCMLIINAFPLFVIGFWDGFFALGAGLFMLGVAVLCLMGGIALCVKLVPAVCRLLVRLLQWPFKLRKEKKHENVY